MKRHRVPILAVLLAGTAFIAAPAANASTDQNARPCVTRTEFMAIHKGMTRQHIERRVFHDRHSWLASGGAGGYVRGYHACDGTHAAQVEYQAIWRGKTVVGARFNGFKRWVRAR